MGCLYQLTSPSGKSYIGITLKTAQERFEDHKVNYRRRRTALHRAFRKYGPENFQLKTLVIANDWKYLCDLECEAIVAFGTKGPSGYNMTGGGDGVVEMCAESKEIHRENTSKGTLAAWQREDYRKSRAAAQARPEVKEKLRRAIVDAKLWDREEYREKRLAGLRDPEVRARISASVSRLWKDPAYRENNAAKKLLNPLIRTEESKREQSEKMRKIIAERKAAGTYWLQKNTDENQLSLLPEEDK